MNSHSRCEILPKVRGDRGGPCGRATAAVLPRRPGTTQLGFDFHLISLGFGWVQPEPREVTRVGQ